MPLLLLLVLAGAIADLDRPSVLVPFERDGDHLVVAVRIDGEGPFRFGLDTGASYEACVDRRVAERLGLRAVGASRNADGLGRAAWRELARIDALDLGGARFTGVTALVDDYRRFDRDGLLGFALFRDLLLAVDYRTGALELSRGEIDADAMLHVASFDPARGAPEVRLEIRGVALDAVLDTGSASTVLLPASAIDALRLRRRARLYGTARTPYGQARLWRARLAAPFTLAGLEVAPLEVEFVEDGAAVLVGNRLLERWRVVFDASRGRVGFAALDSRP